jgi:hypothetical protein
MRGPRRRVLVVAVVAAMLWAGFGALLPAHQSAKADTLSQTCASQLGAIAPCVLLDRVQSGTAAACRIVAGAATPACQLTTGQDISPAAVASYQQSWTHRALTLQRALGDSQPLVNSDWVSTHNSFNSASYLPTLSGLDPNQQVTIPTQLDLDVRGIELDPHWFPSAEAGGQYAVVVCHATDVSQVAVGCSTEALLTDRLRELRSWLQAHPGDVIFLYLDENLEVPAGFQAAADTLEAGLGDLIWHPAPASGCQGLPLSVSRDQIRAAGKQVVIMSRCGVGGTAWTNVIFNQAGGEIEHSVDGTFRPYPACDPGWDRATLQSHFARIYEDSTFVSAVVGAPSPEPRIDAATLHEMVRCGIDEVGLDQLVPNDPRLTAFVWSWAANEPSLSTSGTCAVAGSQARFSAAPCTQVQRFACLDAAGAWHVTTTTGPQTSGDASCAVSFPGSTFAVPHTGYQDTLLLDAMAQAGATSVWLRYAASNGSWSSA